jgi:trk system potassium uptake protein TrkA
VRGSEVVIAHSNTIIKEEDHVILFLVNKRYISHVEKLFHVDAIYF